MSKNFLFYFFIFFLLIGCSGNPQKSPVPVVTIDKDMPVRDLFFSELVDSIKVIPLETTDESLVPGDYNLWCNEKYILILSDEKVLQFSRDGKYVRTVAQRGRAPGEYSSLAGYAVNDATGKLYIADFMYGVNRYDLHSGNFEEKCLTEAVMAREGVAVNNSVIFLPQLQAQPMKHEICYMDEKAGWEKSIKGPARTSNDIIGKRYLANIHGDIHFMADYADTLYTIKDTIKYPLLYIDVPERYTSQKKRGNVPGILFENSQVIIVEVYDQRIVINEDYTSTHWQQKGIFIYDKEKDKTEKLGKFNIDADCDIFAGFNGMFFSGRIVAANYGMIYYRRQLQRALDNDNLSSGQRQKLTAFMDKTSDEDNPVIITGILK